MDEVRKRGSGKRVTHVIQQQQHSAAVVHQLPEKTVSRKHLGRNKAKNRFSRIDFKETRDLDN